MMQAVNFSCTAALTEDSVIVQLKSSSPSLNLNRRYKNHLSTQTHAVITLLQLCIY